MSDFGFSLWLGRPRFALTFGSLPLPKVILDVKIDSGAIGAPRNGGLGSHLWFWFGLALDLFVSQCPVMKQINVPQSGSQASTTASRNRFGQYLRNRRAPTQPRTEAQTAIRSMFTSNAQGWRLLTDEQRSAWTSYATAHPLTDSLGQSKVLTGFMQFVSTNTFLLNVGEVVVVLPPSDVAVGDLSGITVTSSAVTQALNVTGSDTVEAGRVSVFASEPVSAGVSFMGNFRYMASVASISSVWEFELGPLYTAKFGAPPLGKKIFIKVVPFAADGTRGTEYRSSVVVTT